MVIMVHKKQKEEEKYYQSLTKEQLVKKCLWYSKNISRFNKELEN
jgi:hypothetical protein